MPACDKTPTIDRTGVAETYWRLGSGVGSLSLELISMAYREITDADMSAAAMKSGLPLDTVRAYSVKIYELKDKYGWKDLVAALNNWCRKEAAAIVRKSTWKPERSDSDPRVTPGAPDPSTAFYARLGCRCSNCRSGFPHDYDHQPEAAARVVERTR